MAEDLGRHPGDEAAVAAFGEAFDQVLVVRGDELVAALLTI